MTDCTAEKILKAARCLFVQHGFAGTSIAKIAKSAGVNHSLIFHHFGTKIKLWHAVKRDIVHENDNRACLMPSQDLTFKQFIRELLKNKVEFYQNNPDVVQLLNWQRVEAENQPEIGILHTKEIDNWLKAFQTYQDKGEANKELKPEFYLTIISAVTAAAALDPNVFIQDPKSLAAYLDFCTDRICS